MKETILSNCEKNFVLKAASELKRLDGRSLNEFRNLKISFGNEWGSCYVSLGETKVLAQTSCEILPPKTTRPNEGLLFINVEINTMAAAHFEPGRTSDLAVHLNRLLEKCIKDSNAVDLESLCIVGEDKAWALRVDVNVLNHEGSIVDCASAAALASLAHFRRPDVTTDGQEIKIHEVSERDPIPTTLHHYPVCVSFALMNNGENVLADPTAIEEKVSEASLIFGVNAYRELCGLHLVGGALAKPKLILKYSLKAAERAKEIVQVIKSTLTKDEEARKTDKVIGFIEQFKFDQVTSMSEDRLKVQLRNFNLRSDAAAAGEGLEVKMDYEGEVVNLGDNCAELTPSIRDQERDSNNSIYPPKKIVKKGNKNFLEDIKMEVFGEGGASKWDVDMKIISQPDEEDSSSDEEITVVPMAPKQIENIELSGDSEEEEILVLNAEDITGSEDKDNLKKASKNSFIRSSASTHPKIPQKEISKVKVPKKNRKRRKK